MKALRRDRVCDVCGAAAASAVTVTPARVREEQRNRGQVGGQASVVTVTPARVREEQRRSWSGWRPSLQGTADSGRREPLSVRRSDMI